MQTFATPAAITATIEIAGGRLHLIATDRADTTVEVRPADPAKNRDAKAAEQVEVSCTDASLHIRTAEPKHQYLGPSGAVEVTVHLPAGSRVQAKSAACELRTTGPLGDLAFDGAYRQIHVAEAASLRLTAVDGDVEVGRLTGPAEITTSRGAIRIAEAHHGRLDLRTQSGDITVGAATGVSAALDAATSHGRITNSLRNTGTTELDIHATTPHGDITARAL
ncbi:DUF4097 family beta strand repeat-containing protein [Kitasatospora viridis]|uniref:Putative adhesin n=1 Tax=Kitasatospora viridis TaxID=281105 RepID=A0A561UG34_9ACTN|nr:DUF4097 family beta strand repeat-containing protein [Kitasatospora viridis]TWF98308.1 putative adhesin [Kitasatospora viridis]